MNKDNFIKIDKEFYINLSSKEILVLLYLYNKCLTLENFSFILKDLITYYGYKPNPRKNQINQLFVEALNKLIEKQIIYLDTGYIRNINQLITGGFKKNDKGSTYFDTLDQFIKCYSSEIQKIYLGTLRNLNTCYPENTIQVYLYLKKFLYYINSFKYSYPSLNTISKDLKISKPTILKALNDLEKFELIYKKNIGSYINRNGNIVICNNFYCFENYDIKDLRKNFEISLKNNFVKWC